jgi:hypothetical protein
LRYPASRKIQFKRWTSFRICTNNLEARTCGEAKHQSTENVWATCHGGHVARVSPEPRVFANNELQTRPNYDQNTITWEIQLVQCQRSSPKLCFKVALKWVSKDQTNLYDLPLHLTYGYRGVKDKTCFYICRIWMTLKSALIPSWGMTITRT